MHRLHRKRREIFPCAFCLPVKVKQNEIFYFAPLSHIRKDEKNLPYFCNATEFLLSIQMKGVAQRKEEKHE